MSDPKDQNTAPRGEDKWGVGQMDDGKIDSMDPLEAAAKLGERQAFEEAFDEDDFEDGEDLDDVSDLDDEYDSDDHL